MNNRNIFRLSALLYKDDNYNLKKGNILRKVLESLFIDDNEKITIYQTIKICEEKYSLNITKEEILKIIQDSSLNFEISYENSNTILFNLTQNRYTNLQNFKDIGIDKFIDDFIISCVTENTGIAKEVIYRFLYDIFTSNLNSYEYFLKKKEIGDKLEFSVDYSNYNENEIDIINAFLEYDSLDKDKEIFNIVSLALEYCILTGSGTQVYPEGLRNKVFYLDSNIIYRAIGLNGSERKELTIKFIEKCLVSKISLQISKYYEEEFENSIDYHIKQIEKRHGDFSNLKLYEKYESGKDIYYYYLQWKGGKNCTNITLFKAHVKSLYEEFKKKYRIFVDYTNVLEKKQSTDEQISTIEQSIGLYKIGSSQLSNNVDAKNILLIDNMRRSNGKNNNKLLETKYFLISTDQKLREWNYINYTNEQPIVFLPSQWLAIILRFISATDNDYKSFVSFLNIKKNDSIIPIDKLQTILDGISEITQQIERQEFFASAIIEEEVEGIVHVADNVELLERVKDYVHRSLDEQIATAELSVELVNKQITEKNVEIKKQDEQIVRKNSEIQKQNEEILIRDEKINMIIKSNIDDKMKSWRKQLTWIIPIFVVESLFSSLYITFDSCWFNFIQKIYSSCGDNKAKIWFMNGLSSLIVFPLIIFTGKSIWSRVNKNSKKYKEKYELVEAEIKKKYIITKQEN